MQYEEKKKKKEQTRGNRGSKGAGVLLPQRAGEGGKVSKSFDNWREKLETSKEKVRQNSEKATRMDILYWEGKASKGGHSPVMKIPGYEKGERYTSKTVVFSSKAGRNVR